MLTLLEILASVVYLAFGFRYSFALIYAEEIRERLKLTERKYNNADGRWEEVKVHTSVEGDWNNVAAAAG
jgi:hypothetical protein